MHYVFGIRVVGVPEGFQQFLDSADPETGVELIRSQDGIYYLGFVLDDDLGYSLGNFEEFVNVIQRFLDQQNNHEFRGDEATLVRAHSMW